MLKTGPGKRLIIYLGESDSWRGRSLYMSILETLRQSGIAGSTVTRGLAGFGAHSHIRTTTVEVLSLDLPIVITVVDTPENIERALHLVNPMVREGLITLDDVEIIKYSHRYLQPLPADRPVSEFMTRQVATVAPDTPIVEVVELLLGKLYRALPVIDAQQRVLGMITNEDLLEKGGLLAHLSIGQRLSAEDLHVFMARLNQEQSAREIMSSPATTVNAQDALGHVVQFMLDKGLKRFPVVDEEQRLVGMISRLDVLRAVARNGHPAEEEPRVPQQGQTIAELMSATLPVVYVNDDLVDVLEQMLSTHSRWLVVLDEQGLPAGIITDGDVVARVRPEMRRNVLQAIADRVLKGGVPKGAVTARALMSEKVLTAAGETGVTDAIALMLQEGRKRLVVVNDAGRPIGVVDRQALLAASLGAWQHDAE